MSRIRVIESIARQQGSVSRQLTEAFIQQWKIVHPGDSVQVCDLASSRSRTWTATCLAAG